MNAIQPPSTQDAASRTFKRRDWQPLIDVKDAILKFLFGSAIVRLTEDQKRTLEQRRLTDLAATSRLWLSVLLIAGGTVGLELLRKPEISLDRHLTSWWLLALVASMLPYFLLRQLLPQSGTMPDRLSLQLKQVIWSGWLVIVALIWLSGALTLVHRPTNFGPEFALWRETFVYLTILGQVFTVCFLAPSAIALLSVICLSVVAPVIIAWFTGNLTASSPTNFYVFYFGHVLMFVLVSLFVAANQKQFYVRDILLEQARSRAITERARANNFIVTISHDLKTPLTALALRLTMLKEKAARFSETQVAINEMKSLTDSIASMVDAAFDLSRLESGLWAINIREVALPILLGNLANQASAMATDKGLLFQKEAIPPYLIKTDPHALERILHNLLLNAIRYTPAQTKSGPGKVSLECEQTGDEALLISVTDNGIGIPEEKSREIFKEYVQLGNPERDRTKGFGLGLSIVAYLAEMLGHEVKVESTLGSGSKFSVVVPIAARIPPELLSPQHVANGNPDLAGTSVVLIEDDRSTREALVERLSKWGCDVVDGGSAEEVIAKIEDGELLGKPNLILSDYRLRGGVTGLEAIAVIRKVVGEETPSIICTAETSPDVLRKITATSELLTKPIKEDQLLKLLRKYDPAATA